MTTLEKQLQEAVAYLKEKTTLRPKTGIILGSGLGSYGDSLENAAYIDYKDIPHFPVSTVPGHKGRFVITDKIICMQGRFHYYEGYHMNQVAFPVRVMALLGVKNLIVTNAAGGVNTNFTGSQLMLITDHINLMGTNPLIGENLSSLGERFPDMTNGYDKELQQLALQTAKEQNIPLQQGVYVGFTGPNFETPAEIRMVRALGGDAVGMSTVPDVLAAVHCGIRVLGISCITNMASGVENKPLSHKEVLESSEAVKENFILLISRILEKITKN